MENYVKIFLLEKGLSVTIMGDSSTLPKEEKTSTFRTLLFDDSNCCAQKNMHMVELNIDLTELANYLIQFFYKTDERYTCTRTKIGKLLSIAQFYYVVKKNKKLFRECIYKYGDCGTSINELKLVIDRDVYLRPEYMDAPIKISESEIKSICNPPSKYQQICHLPDEGKNIILDVFIHFGAYSASDLGKLLMPIISIDNVVVKNDQIDLETIYKLKLEDFQINDQNNDLIKYIYER